MANEAALDLSGVIPLTRADDDASRDVGRSEAAADAVPRLVNADCLRPNPRQPRRRFDDKALWDLANSLKEKGILQPILVRPSPARDGMLEIVAGERRWHAARLAGLDQVPVVVRDVPDGEALELSLVENIQRQDLSPLETAQAYRRLSEEFGHKPAALARVVSKSRSHVANMLRLLDLPSAVQRMLDDGDLSAGHARALLGAEDADGLARRVVAQGLSVRQTERLVHRQTPRRADAPGLSPAKLQEVAALEEKLSAALGLQVSIAAKGAGGALTIRYDSWEQLKEVLLRLLTARDAESEPLSEEEAVETAERDDIAYNSDAYGPAPVRETQRELADRFGLSFP